MSKIRKVKKSLESILKSNVRYTPVQINLLVSYSCNLACGYCYQHSQSSEEMSFEDFKNVVGKGEELGVGHFNITGGEPLRWPNIIGGISYLTEKNFLTYLTSNGFLLTDRLAEDLGKAELDILSISLDGINSLENSEKTLDKHDTLFTGRLKYLRDKYNMVIILNGVVGKESKGQIPELLQYAHKNKFLISLGFEAPNPLASTSIKYESLGKKVMDSVCDASKRGFLIEPVNYFIKPEFDCFVGKKKSLSVGPDLRIQYCFKTGQKTKGINEFSKGDLPQYVRGLRTHISKCNRLCVSNCAYMGSYYAKYHPMSMLKLFVKAAFH